MTKPTVSVNVNDLDVYICPNCENPFCSEVFILKYLPAIQSPNGQQQVIKVPSGFVCVQCGAPMLGAKTTTVKAEDFNAAAKSALDKRNEDALQSEGA